MSGRSAIEEVHGDLRQAAIEAMPIDRQEVAALVPLFEAASECAQRWGWDEERFVKIARVCWRWVATGKIEQSGDGAEVV